MTENRFKAALLAISLAGFAGCAANTLPDPKDTIKGLFVAMRSSDTTYIATHIDYSLAAISLGEELPHDSTVSAADSSRGLLAALTGDGTLRTRWLENQIVLGRVDFSGDTAWVEVSFIDRLTRVQYYNKMCLDYRIDHWVINSFRTL